MVNCRNSLPICASSICSLVEIKLICGTEKEIAKSYCSTTAVMAERLTCEYVSEVWSSNLGHPPTLLK